VFYSLNGGTNYSQIGTDYVTGSPIEWTVPNVLTEQNNCIIAINAYDSDGIFIQNNQDKSNAPFTIKPVPVVNITAPINGSTLKSGNTETIQWDLTPGASSYSLYYSITPGVWKRIVTLDAATNSFDWTVVSVLGTKYDCIIAVNANVEGVVGQGRIESLTIQPSITVTQPTLNEAVLPQSNYQIVWNQEPWILSNKLFYSLDQGANWVYIGSVVDGSTSFDWSVPNTNSSNVIIGIHGFLSTDASGAIASQDYSDVFLISP